MPKHSLAPGFVKITYTTTVGGVVLTHNQKLSVSPAVWSGATSTVNQKSGVPILWSTGVNNYVAVLRALLHNTSSVLLAELWRQDTPASDPIFVANSAIALAGLSGVATNSMVQSVFTLFGADDSLLKLTIIEGFAADKQRIAYSALGAGDVKNMFDHFTSGPCIFWTRGNSFCVTPGIFTTKVNDKIRKIRLGL